jgi:hypothetical protein
MDFYILAAVWFLINGDQAVPKSAIAELQPYFYSLGFIIRRGGGIAQAVASILRKATPES